MLTQTAATQDTNLIYLLKVDSKTKNNNKKRLFTFKVKARANLKLYIVFVRSFLSHFSVYFTDELKRKLRASKRCSNTIAQTNERRKKFYRGKKLPDEGEIVVRHALMFEEFNVRVE